MPATRRKPTIVDVARRANVSAATVSYVLSGREELVRRIGGDTRKRMADLDGPFDLILFSPPYPNSFDYTDIYNLELWVLGYLASAEDNLTLRRATLRSHVQIKRDDDLPATVRVGRINSRRGSGR